MVRDRILRWNDRRTLNEDKDLDKLAFLEDMENWTMHGCDLEYMETNYEIEICDKRKNCRPMYEEAH